MYKIEELRNKHVAVFINSKKNWQYFVDNNFEMTVNYYGPCYYFINKGSFSSYNKEEAERVYGKNNLMINDTDIEELNPQSCEINLIL